MSEKSWSFFPPVSFDTKFSLFTLMSTYLVLIFCAIFIYVVSLLRYINLMFYIYG